MEPNDTRRGHRFTAPLVTMLVLYFVGGALFIYTGIVTINGGEENKAVIWTGLVLCGVAYLIDFLRTAQEDDSPPK